MVNYTYQIAGRVGILQGVANYFRRSAMIAEESSCARPGEAELLLKLRNGASIRGFYDPKTDHDVVQVSENLPLDQLEEIKRRIKGEFRETPELVELPSKAELEDII